MFFLYGLKFRDIFVTFLFAIKHSYLVTPKIAPDVSNYLIFTCRAKS